MQPVSRVTATTVLLVALVFGLVLYSSAPAQAHTVANHCHTNVVVHSVSGSWGHTSQLTQYGTARHDHYFEGATIRRSHRGAQSFSNPLSDHDAHDFETTCTGEVGVFSLGEASGCSVSRCRQPGNDTVLGWG